MERLRVAMVIQAFAVVGGAEQQLANLAPALERAGVDVHIITRGGEGVPKLSSIPGATLHTTSGSGPKVKASLSHTASAIPLLRRLRPDVIHTHDLYSPTTIACLAKGLTRAGVVAKSNCGGEFGNVQRMQHKRLGPTRLRIFRRMVDAFVVISDEIDDELASIGVPADKRVRVPNGVDITRYSPAVGTERAGLRAALGQGDAPLVVYTGRFHRQKGTDVLLRAWPLVMAQRPDARLLLVGTPRDPDVPSWDTDQPGVVLTGPVNDVAPILRAADVFVNASRAEGLSNSVLEALAVGLPVVATDIGGNRELITPERTGLLVPPEDEGALAAGILRGLDDPGAAEWGSAARAEMVQSYSLDAVAQRLAQLYAQVSSGR